MMEMTTSDAGDGVLNVALSGRLDTPGVDQVETKMTAIVVQRGQDTIVDLSHVEFVGSMGIRMFMTIARAQSKKGKALVLYAPQPLVSELFDTVSLRDIIPVEPDAAAALRAARG